MVKLHDQHHGVITYSKIHHGDGTYPTPWWGYINYTMMKLHNLHHVGAIQPTPYRGCTANTKMGIDRI